MLMNKFLQESAQRAEQLKRQKLMKERRDHKAESVKTTRQYIQIGKLVCKYFPSLLDHPSQDGGDAHKELEFFEYFLNFHHNNPKITQRLRDMFEHQNL